MMNGLKEAIILDLDGTVADYAWRLPLILDQPDKPDWKNFQRLISVDEPFPLIVEIVRYFADTGRKIVIFTARSSVTFTRTLEWLKTHDVPHDLIFMRPEGDERELEDLKRDFLFDLVDLGYTPVLALEDHPGSVAMFEEEGVQTLKLRDHWDEGK